ncbi:MAG: SRPBCC family protein [Solirubrobacteraceae bacterium]
MTDLIHRELELDVPLSEVWSAVTDPERLSSWLADEVSLEPWPGGEASFTIGERVMHGWVEEVRAPAGEHGQGRLAFWWAEGDEPASRVELTVSIGSGGTLLRVEETRPLDVVDLVGIPLGGQAGRSFGPAMVAA